MTAPRSIPEMLQLLVDQARAHVIVLFDVDVRLVRWSAGADLLSAVPLRT